mmetsp:Transcript_40632/g.46191  ORF Transcript_40632/g.46191 Transcript_40632/m.46191 type:complete len:753 (-) Transcript_40632:299-2557(-)
MNHRRNGKDDNKRGRILQSHTGLAPTEKGQVGNAGTFLLQHSESLLDDEKIVGTFPTKHNNSEVYKNLSIISEFLKQHVLAVVACSSTNGNSMQNTFNASSTKPITAASYYLPTVRDFEELQLEYQSNGLSEKKSFDTEKESSPITNGHASALKIAIVKANDRKKYHDNGSPTHDSFGISKHLLCYLHSILCQSHSQKGKFRTTEAQADNIRFCSVKKVDAEIENLLTAQNALWSTWWVRKSRRSNDLSRKKEIYDAVSMAAILMYAINDIHPFADGNGRISRICANYVLRRVIGLPFSITMIATPVQRQKYTEGIKKARISVRQLISKKNESMTKLSLCVKENGSVEAGAFGPVIYMILDRIAISIHQLQKLLDERGRAVISGEEARIARMVREQVAAGRCVICLSEGPNIATLCCGQGVHLNCIAEWLANHTTCMSCRSPMPQLVCPRTLSRVEDSEVNNPNFIDYSEEALSGYSEDEIFTSREISTSASIDMDEDALWMPESVNEYTSSSEDDSSSTEAYSYANSNESRDSIRDDGTVIEAGGEEESLTCRLCQNRAALNCGNHMCGRCCRQINCSGCNHHMVVFPIPTSQDPEESALTVSIAEGTMMMEVEESPLYCQLCSNLAALDCENQMCGHCCRQNNSNNACYRHGNSSRSDSNEHSLYDEYTRRISSEASLERIIEDIAESVAEDNTNPSVGLFSNDASDRIITDQICCSQCNNLAAGNCVNHMCGKCCTSHLCNRHNQSRSA